MNDNIRTAQTPTEATLALAFCQQAIRILEIDRSYPHKTEIEQAAVEHLLLVFSRPQMPAPARNAVATRRRR